MSTFAVGAGTKLGAGLQYGSVTNDYFHNTDTVIDTSVNITSFSVQPSVEKGTEENLLATKVKDSSYLLSITVDGSFDANLRGEMTDWLFKAATQNPTVDTSDPDDLTYTLAAAGSDPLGSTLVLQKNNQLFTYPGVSVRTFTLNAPNNDFVSVSCDIVGREEIIGNAVSKINPSTSRPQTTYIKKDLTDLEDFETAGFIVTNAQFLLKGQSYCIESATLTIDNGLEDAPRCYQDGKFANIPVMGRRSVTLDFNMPYTSQVETWKDDLLLDTDTGSVLLILSTADGAYTMEITIPALSLTSVDSTISGTGVIEASMSGEAIMPTAEQDPDQEPLKIRVIHDV